MTTLAVAFAEIAALRLRIEALEGGGARSSGGGSSGGGSQEVEPLDDHMLDNTWANKKISKDPKQWKGPTQVNRTYSRAPADWLVMAARNMEFKAMKGREENPVRCRNDGKPWHESDTFEARILRGWARRNAGKSTGTPSTNGAAAPAPAGGTDDFDFGGSATGSDDEIPF